MSPKCIFPDKSNKHPKIRAIMIGPERSACWSCSYSGFYTFIVIKMRCFIKERSIPMSMLKLSLERYLITKEGHRLSSKDLSNRYFDVNCSCIQEYSEGWTRLLEFCLRMPHHCIITVVQIKIHYRKGSKIQIYFSLNFFSFISWYLSSSLRVDS